MLMRRINGLVLLLVLVLLMVVFVVSPAPLVISPTTTTTTSSSETPELDALAPSSLPSLPSYPLPSLVYDDVKKDGDVVEFLRGATTTAASPHQNDGLAGQVVEAIETKNAETLNRLFECPICLDSLSSDSLVSTQCGHYMHRKCFNNVPGNKFCVICRQNVGPRENLDRESLFQKALVLAESKGWIRSSSDHGAAGVAASADDIRDDAAALVEERNNATRMTESETFYEEFMLDRFYNNFALFRYTNLVLAMKIYESRKTKFFRMNSTQRLETIEGIREAAVRLLLLLDPAMEKVEWYLPAVIPSDRSDKTIGTQDMSDWLGKLGETVYQSLLVALNQDGVGVYGRTKDYWPDRLNLVIDLLKRIDEAIYSKRNVQTREVFDYASHVRMVVLLLSGGVAVMEEVQSDDIWKSYIRLDEEVYNVNRQHTGCKMNPSQDGCGEIMLQRPIII